jgi:hypothetical protein
MRVVRGAKAALPAVGEQTNSRRNMAQKAKTPADWQDRRFRIHDLLVALKGVYDMAEAEGFDWGKFIGSEKEKDLGCGTMAREALFRTQKVATKLAEMEERWEGPQAE